MRRLIRNIKLWIKIYTTYMINPYSFEDDFLVKNILKNGEVSLIRTDRYVTCFYYKISEDTTIKLIFWTANKYFAYASIGRIKINSDEVWNWKDRRLSRSTILKLEKIRLDYLEKLTVEKLAERYERIISL